MKKIQLSISPKFSHKIKSFLISNGTSKIILARQFVKMTRQEVQALHSAFIVNLSAAKEENINSFSVNNLFYLYHKFSDKIYFVLITESDYNPIEANNILKSITTFISSITTNSSLPINETIKKNSFDIILSVDDIINPVLGDERVSQSKLKQSLKMESFEAEYFNKKQQEKIDNAHQQLVKGIEEIERLKYENKYTPNSISHEDIEKKEKDLIESQRIIEEIAEEREKMRSQMNGMNLNRQWASRLANVTSEEKEQMSEFVNACQGLVEAMMLRELQRIQNEDDDETELHFLASPNTGIHFLVSPIQFVYSSHEQNDDNDN